MIWHLDGLFCQHGRLSGEGNIAFKRKDLPIQCDLSHFMILLYSIVTSILKITFQSGNVDLLISWYFYSSQVINFRFHISHFYASKKSATFSTAEKKSWLSFLKSAYWIHICSSLGTSWQGKMKATTPVPCVSWVLPWFVALSALSVN